jgi:hypothetical protein
MRDMCLARGLSNTLEQKRILFDLALPHADVVGNGVVEDDGLLGNEPDLLAPGRQTDRLTRDTIDQYLALARPEHQRQQVHQRGFTGPGLTDQGHRCQRRNHERDTGQHITLFLGVREMHVT